MTSHRGIPTHRVLTSLTVTDDVAWRLTQDFLVALAERRRAERVDDGVTHRVQVHHRVGLGVKFTQRSGSRLERGQTFGSQG